MKDRKIRIAFFVKLSILVMGMLMLTGCMKSKAETLTKENIPVTETAAAVQTESEVRIQQENTQKGSEKMVLFINDTAVDVSWEDNKTVKELKDQAAENSITVAMSMYGGWEQVGSLGKSYTRNDTQITTGCGDIVLYSGNQIVVFYGSNSWAYTRLGKMNLSDEEVKKLLSNGDVTLKLTAE